MTDTSLDPTPEVAPELRGRLVRYRVIAYVVGVFLLVLALVAMPLKYAAGRDELVALVGPLHGFLYMVYLVLTTDLALRARWTMRSTLLVLLAGTVPFLSFYAERVVVRRVRNRNRL